MSFRLSEEEYESLRDLSISNGARSVSEFTRSQAFQNNSLDNLSDVIEALDQKLQHLTDLLEKTNGNE